MTNGYQTLSMRVLKNIIHFTQVFPSPIGEFFAVFCLIGALILLSPVILLEALYLYGKFVQDTLG